MRLIDADALIENCKKYLNALNPDREVKEFARIYWLIGVLENAPTVELECKRPHWIISSDGYYPYCSECKSEPKNGEMTDFCPNCGAKMRGTKDG